MLDDILTSSVFTLIAAGVVAVAAASLHPSANVASGADTGRAAATVNEPSQPMAAIAETPPTVVRLPSVLVTGRRAQPSDAVLMAEMD